MSQLKRSLEEEGVSKGKPRTEGKGRNDATDLVEESSFRLAAEVLGSIVAVDKSLDKIGDTEDAEDAETVLNEGRKKTCERFVSWAEGRLEG